MDIIIIGIFDQVVCIIWQDNMNFCSSLSNFSCHDAENMFLGFQAKIKELV